MTRAGGTFRSRLRTLALIAAGALTLTLAGAALRSAPYQKGAELFDGRAALSARLVGHEQPLPAETVRCTNCHTLERTPRLQTKTAATASTLTDTLAPALGQKSLTSALRRRGGPASSYTSDSFCKTLREGVDPAHVMLPKSMPRYVIDDTECDNLWTYLTAP
jgi:hypothetical protein